MKGGGGEAMGRKSCGQSPKEGGLWGKPQVEAPGRGKNPEVLGWAKTME
jgi:hypothetical protein